jgi:hypothetical protein
MLVLRLFHAMMRSRPPLLASGDVASLAEARQTSPAQLYASLQKADRLGELERSITEEKIFNFLLSQSTVEEASA